MTGGGRCSRAPCEQQAASQAAQQAGAQAQQQASQTTGRFSKAMTTCLEGKGYTAK